MYFVEKGTISKSNSKDLIVKTLTYPPTNKNSKVYSYDNIGTESITAYFNIKNSFNKLETIKKFIITILNDNKKLFESINVSKETYKLNKNNIFYKFKEKLDDNFDSIIGKESNISKSVKDAIIGNKEKEPSKFTMPLFIHILSKNKYNILKKKVKETENPDFLFIFQNEYNGKSKSYFYKLFQEYIKERKKLIKYIDKYYGLLAFDFIFDIKYKLDIETNNSVKVNENIDDYKIINKEPNMNNKNFQVGDSVKYNTGSSEINAFITKIDFDKTEPYTIKYKNDSIKNKNVNSSKLKKSNSIVKPTLQLKIHNFDLLYQSIIGESIIKSNYLKKINKIYSNFYESMDNYLSGNTPFNLYNIIVNDIELDINLLKFIFNYVDISMFNKAVNVHFKIKDNIREKINNFETYYDSYIIWYNKLKGYISSSDILIDEISESDFSDYLSKIIHGLT
jgi:hypothetical protein